MMNEENNIISVNKEIDVIEYDIHNIKDLIYTIRGQQVMLDSDVAKLYHYETKYINLAVKRNKERFPESFCFQLTDIETENYGGRRTLPNVFTEQGIAMLSGLLKNDIAVQVSINIMNAFVEMRKFLVENGQVFERLSNIEYNLLDQGRKLSNHEKNFEKIFDELQKNKKEEFSKRYFLMDKFMIVTDIIKTANKKF